MPGLVCLPCRKFFRCVKTGVTLDDVRGWLRRRQMARREAEADQAEPDDDAARWCRGCGQVHRFHDPCPTGL